MDLRKLKTLIDLVSDSNVCELEITEAEGKVRIVKGGAVALAPAAVAASVTVPIAAPAVAASTPVEAPVAPAPAGHAVKAPMVGTFYRAASPGTKPFAEVGSVVKEGQAICLIEAMKILNEIEATASGTITQILCENGQAVEYGQPLFIIE